MTEVLSRMQYIKDEKAKKIADFLLDYVYKDTDGNVVIPMFRVLDALSVINQEKIEYSSG